MDHTDELTPDHVVKRINDVQSLTFSEIYGIYDEGCLLDGTAPERFQRFWNSTSADTFKQRARLSTGI
jgi:hypothetical protein